MRVMTRIQMVWAPRPGGERGRLLDAQPPLAVVQFVGEFLASGAELAT